LGRDFRVVYTNIDIVLHFHVAVIRILLSFNKWRWTGMENRTARLTILIDPRKKKIFEEICAAQDLTPSQVVRKLIRQYIMEHAGNREIPKWLTAHTLKADHEPG
jgi:Ribbon-helix-helix protein